MSHTPQMKRLTPASSETLFTFFETLPGALFFLDDAARIIYANASAQIFTGATREDVCSKTLWRGAPHLVSIALSRAVQQAIRTQVLTEVEYGSPVTGTWLHVPLVPTVGSSCCMSTRREHQPDARKWFPVASHSSLLPRTVYLLGASSACAQAEDDLSALIDAIPPFVWMMRPNGSCDYTGMTAQQVQGNGWLRAIHQDDQQPTLVVWQRAIQSSMPYEAELRVRQGTTGACRCFLSRAMPYKNRHGPIVKWVGTSTNIDEQKRAQQQLKASEENWHALAEAVPQLVWTTLPDGQHEYTNQRFHDYTESTLGHMQSDRWSHLPFIHPDDQESHRAIWQHALDTGAMYEHEERLRNGQTGEYRWFLTRGMPVRDNAGQIVKWFGTCTDIEDQKRTEEALRQSQARVRALIDSNLVGIISTEGEDAVIAEANEAFLRMTGYTQEDVHNRTLTRARITPPEHAPLFERALQEILAHGLPAPFESELVCKDGSRLPTVVGGVPFQEHPRQMVGFVLDNSARKELEQRKDDFISMASHELRNPLTALKLQTTLLRWQLAKQDVLDAIPALSRMENQISKVTRLVEELLDVSKIQTGRLEYRQESVDLDTLLREVAEIMQQSQPSHRILVCGTVETSLRGDRDRLGQVFTNLLSNAIKYSPDAQTIEMDLCSGEDTVTIRVHDHGLGIPRELCNNIFERFYRVTDVEQKAIPGLGMGLYIVAEIVKHYRGTITVDSDVGKGSTFTVTLPKNRDDRAWEAARHEPHLSR